MKILICHDGSSNAQKALEQVTTMFDPSKPELIILCVLDESHDASMESDTVFNEEMQFKKNDLLSKSKSINQKGFETDLCFYIGDPRKMILKGIENKKPDLVVVARRGISGIAQRIFGSTSEFLIQHSKIPVLVFQENND